MHTTAQRQPLAQQQQALLAALRDGGPPPPGLRNDAQRERGLLAYRANAHALAGRALAAAYPVVAALLGHAAFEQLARAFWHHHPPERGDLAQWGGMLALFLQGDDALAALPYLPDVARLEWLLHEAASAADAATDPASFARLTQEDPAFLGLRLAPGSALLHSAYPVVGIVQAHGHDGPDFATVNARLQAGQGDIALVWRPALRPQLTSIAAAEAALVEQLLARRSLPDALDAVAARPDPPDFGAWLAQAVQTGLVLGVCDLNHHPTGHSHGAMT